RNSRQELKMPRGPTHTSLSVSARSGDCQFSDLLLFLFPQMLLLHMGRVIVGPGVNHRRVFGRGIARCPSGAPRVLCANKSTGCWRLNNKAGRAEMHLAQYRFWSKRQAAYLSNMTL